VADAESADGVHQVLMNSRHIVKTCSIQVQQPRHRRREKWDQLFVVQDFAHSISTRTAEEVEDEVIADFNRLRVSHGLPEVTATKSQDLRKLACEGKQRQVHARDVLNISPGASRVMAFTLTDPSKLPESLLNASREPAGRMALARASLPTRLPATPRSGFW